MFLALGRWCARRPRRILAVWAAVTIAVAAAVMLHGRVTSEAVVIPGSDSQAARDAADSFHGPVSGNQPLVLHTAPDGPVLTSAAAQQAVEAAAGDVARVDHVVSAAAPYGPSGRAAMSPDGHTAYISVGLDVTGRDITPQISEAVLAATGPARQAGIEVTAGGDLAAAADKGSTAHSELIGLAAAAVILFLGLRRVLAAGLPLLVGVVGLVISLSAIGLVGHVLDMPSAGATIAAMIGLGVGIDYTLFCLTRFRELLAEGHGVVDAAGYTTASAGKAAAFAGCAVAAALAGLALGGLPLLYALALAPAIAVLVAVLAALTLLPALLALLGHRLGRKADHRPTPAKPAAPAGEAETTGTVRAADPAGARWQRFAAHVAGRPWLYLLASLVLVGVLAAPAAGLTFGQLDAGDKAAGTSSRTAYEQLAQAFGPGVNGPLQVTETLPTAADGPADRRVATVTETLGQTPGVAAVSPARLGPDGRTVLWQVTPTTGPGDPATVALVDRLRDTALPGAGAGTGAATHVGGPTAAQADLNARLAARMPAIIATVVLVAGLLLLLAFRAPVVAAKAAAMNLISVAASYGVLTAVFQWGWGAGLLGLDGPVPIPGYVPLLMFAVLFGLSMDYEVFLLSAVRASYLRHRDNTRAVVDGLAGTARIITSAAMIMVCVFLSYLLSEDPVVKMFGIGLATAVALDATVVRGLLVPTSMVLLGERNWWLPAGLDRILPRVDIEGTPTPPVRDLPPAVAPATVPPTASTAAPGPDRLPAP
ncbi:MMPL family transporter [Streptomyces sp. KS 21]|uniref:MMPL family transporter n=1 Tax=Streptomyces sp. KS 21 TaxID=2485150 RepID=UPI001063440E|nr:MMPL family transporter [Streptomyces sp. KS 21]TDU74246.1 RND superfamily putative drug exporter [Streptomyces sp. KS 21]